MLISTSSFYSKNPKRSGSTPVAAVKTKWHPGIYRHTFATSTFAGISSELQAFPCLRGIQKRWGWRDMETAFGVYDGFADINTWLDNLQSIGKRLIILFDYKSLHLTDKTLADDVVPNYLKTAAYDGGQALYAKAITGGVPSAAGGYEYKFWNVAVRNRLVALANAMGAEFDGHPALEAICLVESSFQSPLGTLPSDVDNKMWIGYFKWGEALRAAFPTTVICMYLNFPRTHLNRAVNGGTFGVAGDEQYTVDGIRTTGIAIGGPNVFPNEWGLGGVDLSKSATPANPPGAFTYYVDMDGLIPRMPSIQGQDYEWTNRPPTSGGHVPTVSELYNFAKNDLRANYLVMMPEVPYWENDVKPFFNANPSIKNSLTGGLDATKPVCYPAVETGN